MRLHGATVAEHESDLHLSDLDVVMLAATATAAAWCGRPGGRAVGAVAALVAARLVLLARPRATAIVLMAVVGLAAATLAGRAWSGLRPDALGPYRGFVELTADPAPRGAALSIVVRIEGERYEGWAHGRVARRMAPLRAGDRVWIEARRSALDADRAARVASRHIVGRVDVRRAADVVPGAPLDRAANRVHELLARGTLSFAAADAALFHGLVLGDDRLQPPHMVEAFRASGLAHLTAVSGQNVAYVVAGASPLLRRLAGTARLVATLALIGWFVVVTRAEPSVLRAGVMAALGATAVARGAQSSGPRTLSWAVTGLVLVDPLIVRSVGFWLSVGATAGVMTVAPRLEPLLPGPRWLAAPAALTLGAQAGVLPVSWAVFGSPPIIAVVTNVLAAPVAGAVMLYGIPAGLVAGMTPPAVAALIHVPSRLGTRWVAVVAQLGARLEPPARWSSLLWAVCAAGLVLSALRRRAAASRVTEPPALSRGRGRTSRRADR